MTAPIITTAPAGPDTLTALAAAVAQANDPFARVVVIADHPDAARSVLHWLGAQDAGMINVTVQTGRRLAAELAGHGSKTLPRTLESHAVRLAAASDDAISGFAPDGRRRFYRSLAAAFREMAELPEAPPESTDETVVADAMNAWAETRHAEYRRLVADKGYCLPADLPQAAAAAIASRPAARLPYVIYYLPRRLSAGDVALAQALQSKGKCAVIAARTGNPDADAPILRLLARLNGGGFDETPSESPDPLQQRAAAGRLSLIAAPDPDEEVRAVIRRIAAGRAPFHRTAIIYRQPNPYDSLLRQELDFARIPYAGAESRTLGDTPTGRLLQGIVDLAPHAGAAAGPIDRERLIAWLTATTVRWSDRPTPADKGRPVPATAWANLARAARAKGPPETWQSRLNLHQAKVAARMKELRGDDYDYDDSRLRQDCANLHSFISALSRRLHALGNSRLNWTSAADHIKEVFAAYRWFGDGETDRDRQLIDDLIASLSELEQWDADYDLDTLQEAIREGLQAPVSSRGQSVGAGVYIGPPAGIAGARYDSVYVVGMVERQFPPRPAPSPWLADNPAERRREAALERYDFLAAVAAADQVTLCWPSAADSRQAYPSRWLVAAANHLHQNAGGSGRLAYDHIAAGAGSPHWLALIPSRPAGLAQLPASNNLAPADANDYRLMHHLAAAPEKLRARSDHRMRRALDARNARSSNALTEWDGKVPADIPRIASIATQQYPISPSALETWAACPYRYFLSRILGLAALPDDDDADELSPLDRGNLVHKILEQFVDAGKQTPEQLLALAEQEFENAVARGIAGHHLLWEMEKAKIRAGLTAFLDNEKAWLGNVAPDKSRAEVAFDEVTATVAGLGEVWFRGSIDRLDVLDNEVRVRDFKTGRTEPYVDGTRGRKADRTIANGQALQLPVYVAAAQEIYPDHSISASYCFPLANGITHDVAAYTDSHRAQSDAALSAIIGSARAGIFPATPDGEGDRANCHWCDFNRLCPTRRRQIWERKGGDDAAVQPYNALGGKAAIKTNGHDHTR